MIFKKIGAPWRAKLNKIANFLDFSDPIAQMQFEYDKAVEK
jgi:hypothetical protein